jgi:hypothetical protein
MPECFRGRGETDQCGFTCIFGCKLKPDDKNSGITEGQVAERAKAGRERFFNQEGSQNQKSQTDKNRDST